MTLIVILQSSKLCHEINRKKSVETTGPGRRSLEANHLPETSSQELVGELSQRGWHDMKPNEDRFLVGLKVWRYPSVVVRI